MDLSKLIPQYPPVPLDADTRIKLAKALYNRADSPELSPNAKASICTFAANMANPPIVSQDVIDSLQTDAQKITTQIREAYADVGLSV